MDEEIWWGRQRRGIAALNVVALGIISGGEEVVVLCWPDDMVYSPDSACGPQVEHR